MDKQTQTSWAQQFRRFAELECPQDPLYVAICHAVAEQAELLALMSHAPATQAKPNLLLAALHERVLAGISHPLADYYPSVGGQRLPDAELPALLLDFASGQSAELGAHMQTRSTQTNEIGRCAILWPALQQIAAMTGRQDLALFDLGSSAGLNLGVDAYHYRYLKDAAGFSLGAAPEPLRPSIDCRLLGELALPAASHWRLSHRIGADPAPIDVNDAAATRWLAACLWPHDLVRAQRLQQALAQARQSQHELRRADDCLALLEEWLKELPAQTQPVLFNSWVLAYFEPAALADFQLRVARLQRDHGLIWLSAEAPGLRPSGLALPDLAAGATASTLWSLQWADSDETRQVALAWSHPHGAWLQWLGIQPANATN
ncbi:DUF2332 domain-containing protein [Roseateles oligotrophus]|uniref:DUF2332 domain-containing protein n=1 Tax=Roseateles oligotrophus TaxID=1769250 RepID=A0ABT2YD60_9BURK|nr:DUF2332 domain-containing protein [Roseateles oligotrophus]MCV2367983.1 DUF2332 domain-containing protein [Roseateles oligotrophus]